MESLDEVFGERIISQGLASRINRLQYMRLSFLGNADRKVYVKNPHYLEEHTTSFRHIISAIPLRQLRLVCRNVFSLCEACLGAEGHYFVTLI
jgi:hypothetical protein